MVFKPTESDRAESESWRPESDRNFCLNSSEEFRLGIDLDVEIDPNKEKKIQILNNNFEVQTNRNKEKIIIFVNKNLFCNNFQ